MNSWVDGDTVEYPPQPPDVNTPWFRAMPAADLDLPEDSVEHSEEYLRGYAAGLLRGRAEGDMRVRYVRRMTNTASGIELDGRQGMG